MTPTNPNLSQRAIALRPNLTVDRQQLRDLCDRCPQRTVKTIRETQAGKISNRSMRSKLIRQTLSVMIIS